MLGALFLNKRNVHELVVSHWMGGVRLPPLLLLMTSHQHNLSPPTVSPILHSYAYSLSVQVTILSWRSTSLYSWSTHQASSELIMLLIPYGQYISHCAPFPPSDTVGTWVPLLGLYSYVLPLVFTCVLVCVYSNWTLFACVLLPWGGCFTDDWMCFDYVHVSLCSDPQGSRARKLCVTLEPALLLKGDIVVSV